LAIEPSAIARSATPVPSAPSKRTVTPWSFSVDAAVVEGEAAAVAGVALEAEDAGAALVVEPDELDEDPHAVATRAMAPMPAMR